MKARNVVPELLLGGISSRYVVPELLLAQQQRADVVLAGSRRAATSSLSCGPGGAVAGPDPKAAVVRAAASAWGLG